MNTLIKKRKRLPGILVLFIATFLISGCGGFKDIDKRIFVIGMGIDKKWFRGKALPNYP